MDKVDGNASVTNPEMTDRFAETQRRTQSGILVVDTSPDAQKIRDEENSAVARVLKATKKGGVLGKKRGKYKKDSRVTQWRQRTKARQAAEAAYKVATASHAAPDVAEPPDVVSPSPSTSNSSLMVPVDQNASFVLEDIRPVEEVIVELKELLSHVKNQRRCPLSAYDFMRHLSILRFLEWTGTGQKNELEAAREVAELLWEHKTGLTRDPRNSIHHKANLIRKWTREYWTKGRLSENTQGTHQKNTAPLAKQSVAVAAQKELLAMSKPSPATLKQVLLTKVFPEQGVTDSRISETTCRAYMEKWGWSQGGYRRWVYKYKSSKVHSKPTNSDSEDYHAIKSDDTVTVGQPSKSPETPCIKMPSWHAPIPSPETAILASVDNEPRKKLPEVGNVPMSYAPPRDPPPLAEPFVASRLPIPVMHQETVPIWTPAPASYPPNYPSPYILPVMSSTFQPQLQSNQYHRQEPTVPAQPVARYVPKPLDHLIPPLPQMMGHKPVFNGTPTTFIADPVLFEPFAHDTTFSGRPNPSRVPKPYPELDYDVHPSQEQ